LPHFDGRATTTVFSGLRQPFRRLSWIRSGIRTSRNAPARSPGDATAWPLVNPWRRGGFIARLSDGLLDEAWNNIYLSGSPLATARK
jgi:hypothetical protein